MATPAAVRMFEGEARVYRRSWRSTAFSSFVSPMLYLLAMGMGLGALVDRNLPGGIDGVSYLAFLAPGLLVANAMMTGAGEGTYKVMVGIKWRKTYDAILATPLRVSDLVLGHLLWASARVLLVAVVFALVMVAFGVSPLLRSLVAVGPALLVGLALAAPVSAYTATLEDDYQLTYLIRFGIVPMFLFSGTFFPIDQLPGWLQPVAYATPLFHAVELARAIVLGLEPQVAPAVSVLYLAAIVMVGTVVAVRTFERRLYR